MNKKNIRKILKEHSGDFILVVVSIIALVVLFVGMSKILQKICRAADAEIVQAATVTETMPELSLAFAGGRNNFVTFVDNGEATNYINVRSRPGTDAEKIGEVHVGATYRVTSDIIKSENGWYGFRANTIGLDGESTVWIRAIYVCVDSQEYPEKLDNPSTYIINLGTACNNNCKVVVTGNPNLRSCPDNSIRSDYCRLPDYSFEITNSFLDETNQWVGLYASEVGASGVNGDISADPDGIVWVSVDYVQFIK